MVFSTITEGSTVNSRSRVSVKINILILEAKNISTHMFLFPHRSSHQEWWRREMQGMVEQPSGVLQEGKV